MAKILLTIFCWLKTFILYFKYHKVSSWGSNWWEVSIDPGYMALSWTGHYMKQCWQRWLMLYMNQCWERCSTYVSKSCLSIHPFLILHVHSVAPTVLDGFLCLAQMIAGMRGCVECNDFWPWPISWRSFGHKTAEIWHILLCQFYSGYCSGVGFLSWFPLFCYFPNFSELPKYWSPMECHVHIWQMLLQLSWGDICPI